MPAPHFHPPASSEPASAERPPVAHRLVPVLVALFGIVGTAQAQDTTARSGNPEIIAIADRYMADYRHPDPGTLETLYDEGNNRGL